MKQLVLSAAAPYNKEDKKSPAKLYCLSIGDAPFWPTRAPPSRLNLLDAAGADPLQDLEIPGSKYGEQASHQGGSLAPLLMTFVEVNLVLVLACCLAEAFCARVLHLPQPYNYPVFDPNYSFGDFKCFILKFQHFRQPAFYTTGMSFMYPAPVAVMYEVFFLFGGRALHLFLLLTVVSFSVAALVLGRALWRRGVKPIQAAWFIAASMVLAYPLWFDFKQANMEIVVWVFVAVGVWAFYKGKDYSAAACFGIAGSMKIFPFVYLGLLLAKRKYREAMFSFAVAAVTSVVSLWLVGPDIWEIWRRTQAGIAEFRMTYMLQFKPGYIGSDHSLFAAYKRFLPHLPPVDTVGHLLTLYLAVTALAGVALYFYKIRHLPPINQVLALCVASILLPPVSFDYTLMHLYVPWAILILFAQEQWSARRSVPGLTGAMVCLAILVSPQTEFILHGEGFGGQIKALALIVLMYLALKYPFGDGRPLEQRSSLVPRGQTVALTQ